MTTVSNLMNQLVSVTQKAAIEAYPWIGRGNKMAADGAGTSAMRDQLNALPVQATIVIGEGEMDEAPMLYIGEKLGLGTGPEIDIAVDPIEGTTLVSKGMDDSLAVMAVAPKGTLLHAPDMYMEKIAVGRKAKGQISLDDSLTINMHRVAKALGKKVSDLTVMMQDRPRHKELMEQVWAEGAKVKLFSEVDITGALSTSIEAHEVDIFVGTGGAPEGVIAAVAQKSFGGDFQGRLKPQNDEEIKRCHAMGIEDLDVVLTLDDIVKTDDCFFAATGITDGPLIDGVRLADEGFYITHSILVAKENTQYVTMEHYIK